MNLPSVDIGNFPVQYHTISLEDAIERTTVWRGAISKLFPSDPDGSADDLPGALVPKSMHIKINDILQIANDYATAGIQISGVRLYFTLENNNANNDYHVKGLLVPTIKNAVGTGIEEDLIMTVPLGDQAAATTGVSIYDFTLPCPTYCGGSSPELTGEAAAKKNAPIKG